MKVPVYDTPQVGEAPLPGARVQVDTRGTHGEALAGGLEQVGAAAHHIAALQEQARKKAATVSILDSETAWQRGADPLLTDHDTGILAATGQDAFARAEGYQAKLQQLRDKVVSGIVDPQARQIATLRINGLIESAHHQVEGYLSRQQHVIAETSLQDRQATALDAVSAGYADPKVRATQMAALDGPVKELALSPEDAQARLAAWHQAVASTVLNQYLGDGDGEGAQQYFAQVKDLLGPKAGQYQHQIQALQTSAQAGARADAIWGGSQVKGYPWHDSARAVAQVQALAPGRRRDEIQRRVEHAAALEQQEKERWGQARLNELDSVWVQSRNLNDPRLAPIERAMEDPHNGASSLLARWIRSKELEIRSQRLSNADERRAIDEADRQALQNYLAHPLADRVKLDVRTQYLGHVSPLGMDTIRARQQRDIAQLGKDQGVGEAELRRDVAAEAAKANIGAKDAKLPTLLAAMTGWWLRQSEQNSGRPPSRADMLKELGHQLEVVDQKHWGGLWHTHPFRFESTDNATLPTAESGEQLYPPDRQVVPPTSAGNDLSARSAAPGAHAALPAALFQPGARSVAPPSEQQTARVTRVSDGKRGEMPMSQVQRAVKSGRYRLGW